MSSPDEAFGKPPLTDRGRRDDYAVAICTYNGARYVAEQLRSIIDARPAASEIVVLDDVSCDDTREVVAATMSHWSGRATVTANPANLGSLRSFERAIGMTTQPIVFLADQDDIWHPDKPRRMLEVFAARPTLLLLHSNARVVDDVGRPLGYTVLDAIEASTDERTMVHHGDAFDTFVRRNIATGATIAFRRTLLDAALPIPAEWVHDEWLATIASAIGHVDYIDDPLIDYRQHANNQIGALRLDLRQRLQRAVDKPGDFYQRQLRRTIALFDRLVSLGDRVPADRIVKVAKKRAHLEFRAGLPDNRLMRAIPIAREWRAGGYRRYSTGMKSVVRDLFHTR